MKIEKAQFIQDENTLFLIGLGLFCLAFILWFYRYDKNENKKRNNDSLSEHTLNKIGRKRFYIIPVTVLIIILFELYKKSSQN